MTTYYEVAFPPVVLKSPATGKFSHRESTAGRRKDVYRYEDKSLAEDLVRDLRTNYYKAVPDQVELREIDEG